MVRLPDDIITTVLNLQTRLLEGIDQHKLTPHDRTVCEKCGFLATFGDLGWGKAEGRREERRKEGRKK